MTGHSRGLDLFEAGRNCWRVEQVSRAAFLIDAASYFKAFVEATRRAERSILIIGWDFHSRTRLLCGEERDAGLELGEHLNAIVRARRGLGIHILMWDYPMIFGLDREWAPLYGLSWKPHRRIAFRYDNTHPVGGSHHQKIVVIDDRVAFNGGIDLTSRRWDTCEHAPGNEHRTMKGTPYPPFHDVMMMVEGPAAAALGGIVRERWRRATHQRLVPPAKRRRVFRRMRGGEQTVSPWPPSFEPDVRDAEVAISRTEPAINGHEGVREVEALYLDMIAAAQRLIYIENQYFTADKIGDALCARLEEPDGPELIVVVRELSHGWLEERTMQRLRTRLIEKLRAADRHGRFGVYYPFIAGLEKDTCIDVHSKVIVIDDAWLRIGSANLANRSFGLDTECDLTLPANGSADVAAAIAGFRTRLIAEHLGVEEQALRKEVERTGSVKGAIEALHNDARTLVPLTSEEPISEAVYNVVSVADPEKPVELAHLMDLLGADEAQEASPVSRGPSWKHLGAIVLVLAGLTAAWQLTPLAEYLDGNRIVGWARAFGDRWWAPLATMAAYSPAALVMFPRPLITLFAVIAFGPILGFVYAMVGIELSAWLTYLIGRRLDRSTVRRIAGAKLNNILQVLRRRGLLATIALRLVPLAPFGVEGVVAGAVHVKLWQFMLGTAIGMLPGVLTSTVFGDQLQVWLEDPEKINYWLIALALAILGAATWIVRRWLIASKPDAGPKEGLGAQLT